MSIFGTLGKNRRRKSSTNHEFSLDKDNKSDRNIFKSTPNLNKLDVGTSKSEAAVGVIISQHSGTVSPPAIVYYDYEKNPRSPFKLFPGYEGHGEGSPTPVTGSNSSISSTSLSVASHDSRSKHDTPNKSASFSSFRGFMSMVSVASGIKKSKSIRRKAFESVTHNQQTDQSLLNEDESIIHEDVVGTSSTATTPKDFSSKGHRTASIKSSQSVPNMETDADRLLRSRSSVDNGRRQPITGNGKYNSEPGVESSSTNSLSSACTNLSENESYASSRSRCESATMRRENADESLDTVSIGSQPSNEDNAIGQRKLMLQAAKKFNMDPKKGIDFLVLSGLLERTPESIAQFLKHGEQLSKSTIGNYLGEHHEFNLEVLHAFVDLHDFTNVLLVEALRQFLWSFRLPGEAQKIDRMMECFAKRYTQLNPTLFANSDTCYLLSFAIIMLNTSLHNPNVKEKPTLEQFIQMNRDIDDGQPLDRKFVTSLYNSILTEPFQIPPEDGNDLMLTFFNPAIEGWLWKQGGRYKTWKRRWFILSNNCLYYFLFTTDKDPRGIIPLENIKVRRSIELGKDFCFTLYKESSDSRMTDYIKSCKASDGKLTAGKHIRYHLATKTKEDRDRWVSAISQNSSYHSFYTMLAEKKNRLEVIGRNTLRKNRNNQAPAQVVYSAGTVRKSQIGLPLTSLDSATAKSMSHIPNPQLLSPDVPFAKNPHQYFSTTTNLDFCGSDDDFVHKSDSGTSYQISFEVPGSNSRDLVSEAGLSSTTNTYSTFSLPRVKSRKKHHAHPHPPVRKFSLPPEAFPSRLTSKVEYLTSPGIRISVEDTDLGNRKQSDEKVVLSEALPHVTDVQIGHSSTPNSEKMVELCVNDAQQDQNIKDEEPLLSPLSPVEAKQNTNSELVKIPDSLYTSDSSTNDERCTSSFINALIDFAHVMENLNLSVEDSGWKEEETMNLEELQTSGLTRQCLRSSVKSKRSRYRQKPRKHFTAEFRTKSHHEHSTAVINENEGGERTEVPDGQRDVASTSITKTETSAVVTTGQAGETGTTQSETNLPFPYERHSEV